MDKTLAEQIVDARAAETRREKEAVTSHDRFALPRYQHNVLEAFGSGCLLDLRVRLAADFLKHSPMFGEIPTHSEGPDGLPREFACFALDLATALLSEADRRGLIEPIPEDNGDLDAPLRAQAKRTASYQALQQLEAQKFVQDEAGRVVPQAPRFTGGRPN